MIDPGTLGDPVSPAPMPVSRVLPGNVRARAGVGLALLLGVIGLAVVLGYGLSRDPEGARRGLDVGRPAPDFILPGLAGDPVRLADHRGHPVVVYFWASWCIPCREEAPDLEALWRAYRAQGVDFIGVNVQDAEEDARAFVREFNLTFPMTRDAEGRVYLDYGVYGVPEAFVVDRDGNIRARWIGPPDLAELVESLDDAIAG